MDPLVVKTLELRRMIEEEEGSGSSEKLSDSDVKKEEGADSIQDTLSTAVSTLAQFHGFHDINASALARLTTVVSTKLAVMARQLAILERRKTDRLPQAYSSPLLHVLALQGVRSYSTLGRYYESRVRATYECAVAAAAAAQLSQQKEVVPIKKNAVKKEDEAGEGEENLQYLGVADAVTGAPCDTDENGNVPKKKRKVAGKKK